MVLTAGAADVSDRVPANWVTWTRQTKGAEGDAALDAADESWNTYHGRHVKQIAVTESDLPSNFWTEREVQFTCTVDSGTVSPSSATITIH